MSAFGRASSRPERTVLRAVGLSLDYEREDGFFRAVEEISFTVGRGERLVLLGPSGCGKSSILKAVAGFIKPSAGHIELNGRPLEGPGPDRVVVFQEFDQLLPWKTVRQNVTFPLQVARGMSRAEARSRAEAVLAQVGLDHVLNAYPHTLSGGMKQRAAIARALATEADVLLMDEPFAALDALTRSRLQDDLLAILEKGGQTLVFVTHSIEEAVLIGSQIHLLGAHPGRTLAVFDVAGLGRRSSSDPAFAAMVGEIRSWIGVGPENHAA